MEAVLGSGMAWATAPGSATVLDLAPVVVQQDCSSGWSAMNSAGCWVLRYLLHRSLPGRVSQASPRPQLTCECRRTWSAQRTSGCQRGDLAGLSSSIGP